MRVSFGYVSGCCRSGTNPLHSASLEFCLIETSAHQTKLPHAAISDTVADSNGAPCATRDGVVPDDDWLRNQAMRCPTQAGCWSSPM